MEDRDSPIPSCPVHGSRLKRATCRICNARYMAPYMRRRRHACPDAALIERARRRARASNLPFALTRRDVVVPTLCPALGIALRMDGKRSPTSPSLDRIRPHLGYVPGNVRVISDAGNRMKGDLDLDQLRARADAAEGTRREAYLRLVRYVDRELILAEVRTKAAQGGRAGEAWAEVARFLDRAFIRAAWSAS